MPDEAIKKALSGPSKARRLSSLDHLKDNPLLKDLAGILLSIENVPSTIADYRNRELHLETLLKMTRDKRDSEDIHVITLHYLLGSLYVNFEKFWGPTLRVITEIVDNAKYKAKLVRLILDDLRSTNNFIYLGYHDSTEDLSEDRPDYIKHRNFVFQLLAKFASHVESDHFVFVEEFFSFVEKEILVSPFIEKFTRVSLIVPANNNDQANLVDCIDEIVAPKHNNGVARKFSKKRGHKSKREPLSETLLQKRKSRETFITAIRIVQSFNDIQKVHRNDELKRLLLDLLCCRDSSVQRAAFNCLLAFDQHKSLEPYSERILKIISDKTAKTELTIFSIDSEETEQVQPKDRGQLMPIVLRVLFGKMLGKIDKKSSGKDKADHRKEVIMRFISGCTEDEIIHFFGLVFEPIVKFMDISYEDLENELADSYDLSSYIPINRLHAMMSSLSAYIDHVAHLKESILPQLLKLINVITYFVVSPLETRSKNLSEKITNSLKSLKRICLDTTRQFFKTFQYYKFSQGEIDFVFKYLIWTSTQGFVDKNHACTTPLFRFIASLAEIKAYHPLLVMRNRINQNEYLLRHIVDCYVDPKSKREVLQSIASIFANLIRPHRDLIDDDDLDPTQRELITTLPMLEVQNAVIPEFDKSLYKIDSGLSFSEEILIGFIPTIFQRLSDLCQEFIDKKEMNYRMNSNELLVLSSLCGYLKDPQQSLTAARLLLMTLGNLKNTDMIVSTLKTVQSLLCQIQDNNDTVIVPLIANFLGYQRNVEQRRELCNVIDMISRSDARLRKASQGIRLMNATSDELIDAPDLVKWNQGFQVAIEYIESLDEATMNQKDDIKDSFTLLIHQVGFIINSLDRHEFSVRENCMIFYEKLAQKISLIDIRKNSVFIDQLINETLLEKFIKKGLRDTNELVKHSYIVILRSLAVHCHEKNKVLGEFYKFCNENQDLDFWQNIKHIQIHNRSKALARLAASEEINDISPKTLSSYFMPIATSFLFSKTYKSLANIAENSIKVIGIICRRLNWITYESTLSYYLDLLTKANFTYQRTNIKLVTEIIKNFNFDLTACKEATENHEENVKLEKRMKRRIQLEPNVIAPDAPSGRRLNQSTARMVYFAVTKRLIPRLNNSLHEMTRVEFEHDKNMSNYLPEKDEIKRIPIAYAIIQLLNLLPDRYILLRDHLPSLFLKLSSFLKSKTEQIRKVSRATLAKVMNFLGPAYMPDLLRVLKQNLDKGFQIHVLNYTIHSVLDKLPLQYGALDTSAYELIDSCFKEIFGKISEDKEIAAILAKTMEAKKTKSYDTLSILSSYISAEKLPYLMNSIKETAKTSNEPKVVNKLATCVQKVFTGLGKNSQFPLDKLLEFIRFTIEESIPSLRTRQKFEQAESLYTENSSSSKPLREDRYLISKDAPRDRIKSKINEKGNLHLIVDNSLRLLLHTFEVNKVTIKKKELHKRKLDGFIGLLAICLKSSSPRCVMRSLKCLYFIAQAKIDLPSFQSKSNSIVKKIFILLSLYNGVGMAQGENLEMIAMCFKTLTLLLLKCQHVQLSEAQVRALISYIEQDLNDVSRQATAFGALHSLVQRKYESPELPDIMIKVANLLVTSEDDKVRSLSVKIWQAYFLEYKHEKDMLQMYLTKFLRQLEYEFADGRKSVLNMVNIVITRFPNKILSDYFELIFYLLAVRVVNEESKELRGIVGRLVGLLLQRSPDQQSRAFSKFIIPWASKKEPEMKLLGVKLISILAESCIDVFANDRGKIKQTLTIISEALVLDSGAKVDHKKNSESPDKTSQNGLDCGSTKDGTIVTSHEKLNYHTLRLFQRLLNKGLISCIEERHIDVLRDIWINISSKQLAHKFTPIVLTSCELYMQFIKKTNLSEALKIENPTPSLEYVERNAPKIVRTLFDRCIDLLDRVEESDQLLGHITGILVALGQLVTESISTDKFEEKYLNSFEKRDVISFMLELENLPDDGFVQDHLPCNRLEAKKEVNLMWMAIKIVMQARKEVHLHGSTKSYRRDLVLRWTAAISQLLGPKRLTPYVFLFLMTPIRELTDKGKAKSVDNSAQHNIILLAEDLLKFIKNLIGLERFGKVYSKLQLYYTRKRVDRKRSEAILRVKDQQRGVKRKMKQSKSKDVKRRKSKIMARKGGLKRTR